MKNLIESLTKLYPGYKWYGPYLRKDGRTYLVRTPIDEQGLTRRGAKKSGITLARAKVEVSLDRTLSSDEHVDHIDGNRSNDSISNLQVLSILEHRIKSGIETSVRQRIATTEVCPACNREFLPSPCLARKALSKNKKACCSRSCASKLYGRNQYTSKS